MPATQRATTPDGMAAMAPDVIAAPDGMTAMAPDVIAAPDGITEAPDVIAALGMCYVCMFTNKSYKPDSEGPGFWDRRPEGTIIKSLDRLVLAFGGTDILGKDLCMRAASLGFLSVLQWARKRGFSWDVWTSNAAAEHGHLDLLIWALANGCPWSTVTFAYAASGGHPESLEWLLEAGCPWDALACHMARNLEVLQWLRAQEPPCPWDARTYISMGMCGDDNAMQWLVDNGCPRT